MYLERDELCDANAVIQAWMLNRNMAGSTSYFLDDMQEAGLICRGEIESLK